MVKPGKIDELNCILATIKNINVVVLVETWIKNETEAKSLRLPNYKHYYNFRTQSRGGGVSIFVHKNIKHEFISDKCEDDNHFIWVHLEKFSLDIGAIYKPERTNSKKFLETFSDELQKRKRTIIFGDFNYNLLVPNRSTSEYKDALVEQGYTILNKIDVNYCTRETSTTKSILDHVCTSLKDHKIHLAIVESAMSDHKQIFLEVERYKPEPIKKVKFQAISYTNLYKTVEDLDYNSIGEEYTRLEEAIQSAINKNKTVKSKILNPPRTDWINKDIINQIDKRNELWRIYKNNPNNRESEEAFKKERNKVFENIQATKSKFYHKSFKECERKPLKMWQLINSLSNNKLKKSVAPSKLQSSTGLITDEKEICECFNDYFSSVGTLLANQIPAKYHNNQTNTITPNKAVDAATLSQIAPATADEIGKIIDDLNANTSTGLDGISVKTLKCIKNLILASLTQCVNKCLSEGHFPDTLKYAKVTPIFKAGSKLSPGNYRPISVLPVLSKVFEKLLHNRLSLYLNSFNYLSQRQYGFRPKSNTLSAATDLITSLKTNIDKKHIALGIFIDLKKAFDTVSHSLLMNKLASIGITGNALKILESYLQGRRQVVKIGDNVSAPKDINCGVPQGSICGPLLFLIYINNIDKIGLKGHISLYADDTCLFYFGHSIDSIIQDAQEDLIILERWFLNNLLTINTSKTNYMIFAAKNKKISDHKPLSINGVNLNKVNEEKYLGLILDNQLTWKPHIEKTRSKILSLTGALRQIVRCFPLKVRHTIYNSLVKPHIEYLIELWGSAAKTNLEKLQRAQNRIIKVLFHYHYLTPTHKIYKETKLFNISDIYFYNTCILVRKILSKDLHTQITLTKNLQVRKRFLRRAQDLHIPSTRTNYGKKTIIHEGAKLYNSLPKDIKNTQSLLLFKKLLKCHILKGHKRIN